MINGKRFSNPVNLFLKFDSERSQDTAILTFSLSPDNALKFAALNIVKSSEHFDIATFQFESREFSCQRAEVYMIFKNSNFHKCYNPTSSSTLGYTFT